MRKLWSCRNRRLGQCVKTCALLSAIFYLSRYLTGRSSLYSDADDDDIGNISTQQQHPSLLQPPPSWEKSMDTFAMHFQTRFRFHNQQTGATQQYNVTRQLRIPDDWPQFFVPRSQQQFSLDYPYLHSASGTCGSSVDLLVMTLSLPQNFLQRQAIRKTWGSVANAGRWPGDSATRSTTLSKRLGVVFLVGEQQRRPPLRNVSEALEKESEKYGDVVQWEGLQDTYFNLTMKVLLGLQWVTEFCHKVSHVVKTDDDTFVHVPRLVRLLTSPNEIATDTIWGPFFRTAKCNRLGKYAVSRDAYPFDFYPPHVKGNLYVLTRDLVSRLVMLAPYLPYNNMEDVHVTGTLARVLGAQHRRFHRKLQFSVRPQAPHACLFQRCPGCLGSQKVSPELAFQLWETFSGTFPCH